MALEDTPRLGCGRSIDHLWSTLDAPAGPHEEHCAQCRDARAKMLQLRQATAALKDAEASDPTLTPRRGLKDSIMEIARAEARRSRLLSVQDRAGGITEISEQALSSVVRVAAAGVPGIRARRCRIEVSTADMLPTTAGTHGTSGGPWPPLIINLRVAAAPNTRIPHTVALLRHQIGVSIAERVGIDSATINITVEDLYDD